MEKEQKHNTIFDDVFRTMVQKMPKLLIPVINEVFRTNYTEKDYVSQMRNEHEEEFGRIITDSVIRIGNKLYHIECQSTEDSSMVVRMIEYDFAIALEETLQNGRPYEMEFPQSCVLYLRHKDNTPNALELKVNLPNGGSFLYHTPIIKVQQYAKDEIFQKKLLLFLPYYIMRYEKQLPEIYENAEKLEQLLTEYEEIRYGLEVELYDEGKSELYKDLIKLIVRISEYMIQSKHANERMGKVMGGKVLELASEMDRRIGREETAISLYRKEQITAEVAAEVLGITVAEFLQKEKEFIKL